MCLIREIPGTERCYTEQNPSIYKLILLSAPLMRILSAAYLQLTLLLGRGVVVVVSLALFFHVSLKRCFQ